MRMYVINSEVSFHCSAISLRTPPSVRLMARKTRYRFMLYGSILVHVVPRVTSELLAITKRRR